MTSETLSEYMLKGWVLTDNACGRCRVTPLLRSPKAQANVVSFCAKCDIGPSSASTPSLFNSTSSSTTSTAKPPPITIPDSSPSLSSSSHISGASTPPTEVSSTLSSPTFAPPVETEDIRRRRAQSDQASAEIGHRLLKGWAMLAEECPNTRCYGVPLVRPPKPGGSKDARKICVVCNAAYISETDPSGWERLVPVENRPNYDMGRSIDTTVVGSRQPQAESVYHATSSKLSSSTPVRIAAPELPRVSAESPSSPKTSIDASAQSLQLALSTLSARLVTLSSSISATDTVAIGTTAEAIGKVTHALSLVRQLQLQESSG